MNFGFPTWQTAALPASSGLALPFPAGAASQGMAFPAGAAAVPTFAGFGGDPFASAYGAGPAMPAAPAPSAPERFMSSFAGGVITGADGKPTGTVPTNSFVDTTDGSVYGPDGKKLVVPDGGSVDFFDLPDTATIVKQAKDDAAAFKAFAAGGGAGAGGAFDPSMYGAGNFGIPGAFTMNAAGYPQPAATALPTAPQKQGEAPQKFGMPPQKIDVAPQKFGVAPHKFEGGGPRHGGAMDGCDMHGGAVGAPATTPLGGSQVAGASGPGVAAPMKVASTTPTTSTAPTTSTTSTAPTTTSVGAAGGGAVTSAVAGASGVGTVPTLESSLAELITTLKALIAAMSAISTRGGGAVAGPPGKGAPTPAQVSTPPAPTTTSTPSTSTSTSTGATPAAGGGTTAPTTTTAPDVTPPAVPGALPATAPTTVTPVTAPTPGAAAVPVATTTPAANPAPAVATAPPVTPAPATTPAVPGAPPAAAAIGFTPDEAPPIAPTV